MYQRRNPPRRLKKQLGFIGTGLRGIGPGESGGRGFNIPSALFAAGEQGGWYDTADFNNYMVTGPELLSGATWSATGSGAAGAVDGGSFTAAVNGATVQRTGLLTVGRWYDIVYTITGLSAGTVYVDPGGSASGATNRSANGTYREQRLCTVSGTLFATASSAGTTATITFNSVRELPNIANATMFQDSTGATLLTAVGQPEGMILDKRLGAVRGDNLAPGNGTFDSATGWTLTDATVTGGQLVIGNNGGVAKVVAQGPATVAGAWYEITFDLVSINGAGVSVYAGVVTTSRTTPGSYREIVQATGTSGVQVVTRGTGVTSAVVDNVVVRPLPGNHRTQSTAASRPTPSARYNLLTKTQELDDAAWFKTASSVSANTATAPDGTATADSLIEDSTGPGLHAIYQSATVTTLAQSFTAKVYIKSLSGNRRIRLHIADSAGTGNNVKASFDPAAGTITSAASSSGGASGAAASISGVGNGWYLCTLSGQPNTSGTSVRIMVHLESGGSESYTGDGTSGVLLWGPDLRLTADTTLAIPAYQRVNTATDYDTAGFPIGEEFDGVDDSSSAAAGGGGTTGFFFCAAVRVAGGAGTNREIWSDEGTNAGHVVRVGTANAASLSVGTGASFTTVTTVATLPVGETHVLTTWHDGTNINIQIDNGAVISVACGPAAAGTSGFVVGKFNSGSSRFFPGRIFSPIHRFGTPVTAAERELVKAAVAKKAGVILV